MDRQAVQQSWYRNYYAKAGAGRNNLRTNPEVLFQLLATEASIVRAIASLNHDPGSASVLDVGCGGGGDIHHLLRLAYEPGKIVGIESQAERLNQAKKLYPQMQWIHGDAAQMTFEYNSFDLVFESTMFATLPDDVVRSAIASEMVRVCRPGGFLVLVDWRTPKFWDSNYKALTRKELRVLFDVGGKTFLVKVFRGALIPPIGRFLSKHLPAIYFLFGSLFPFLVGQVVYVLRKR